jgi:hypothetical protein
MSDGKLSEGELVDQLLARGRVDLAEQLVKPKPAAPAAPTDAEREAQRQREVIESMPAGRMQARARMRLAPREDPVEAHRKYREGGDRDRGAA